MQWKTLKHNLSYNLNILFNTLRRNWKFLVIFFLLILHIIWIFFHNILYVRIIMLLFQSFVGCAWGTLHVSLVSACYGAACAFSSPVSGWMVKLTGRVPIITFAALVIAVDQIMMLYWKPNAENPGMFFVLAVLWGTSLGILFSQIKGKYICWSYVKNIPY